MKTKRIMILSMKVVLYLCLVTLTFAQEDDKFYECLPGMPGKGVLLPKGDIDKEVGSPKFPLQCHLNPNENFYKDLGLRSDDLFIEIRGLNTTRFELSKTVINETSIEVIYDPKELAQLVVECSVMFRNGTSRSLCMSKIHVGTAPQPPENFTCISHNWNDLNCTWDVPYNPISTQYILHYLEPGRRGRDFQCPPETNRGTTNRHFCHMSINRDPTYRRHWPYYQFYMEIKNSLQVTYYPTNQNPPNEYFVNHFAIVRPNPPVEEQISSDSPNTIKISYKIDNHMHFFPPGLKQQVEYRSQYDPPDQWTPTDVYFINTTDIQHDVPLEKNHTITGLLPYTLYFVRIRMLSAAANESDSQYWSSYVFMNATTQSQIPNHPPQTPENGGSFEVVLQDTQTRSIYVYWKNLPTKHHNGPNFGYDITNVFDANHKRLDVGYESITKAYALFPYMKLSNYTFDITSQNEMGRAPSTSRVFVPKYELIRTLQPKSITKIAYTEDLFEISWLAPEDEQRVSSYTIFWCLSENNRDRPYQCDGQLDWKIVPKKESSLNITLPTKNVYQFAVAANTHKYSSGMVWATCTILHNKKVGKLRTVTVDVVRKNAMVIRWRLDCIDRVGILKGYKVIYCPIRSDDSSEDCIDGIEHEFDTEEERATISNLLPWTYYKVGVAVITKAGVGEPSDFMVNRTSADRPGSEPTNITSSKTFIANEVELHWEEPIKPNGPISTYQIQYSYVDHLHETVDKSVITNRKQHILNGLAYNAEYDIKIRACTYLTESIEPVCGLKWAAIKFQTGIGPSGPMPAPMVTFMNSTYVEVGWDPQSFHHGGPIQRYELRLVEQRTNYEYIKEISGNGTKIALALDEISQDLVPDCTNYTVTNLYNFTIRALTFDIKFDNTTHEYSSRWSPVEVVPAYCKGSTPWVLIIIIPIIVVIMAFIGIIYGYKFYTSYHDAGEMFKEIDKEAEGKYNVDNKNRTNNATNMNGTVHNSPDKEVPIHDWTEMQGMSSPHSGKRADYQRTASKDSMENLLNKERKSVIDRGTSESTSGCDSGHNYESDELDNVSAKSGSHPPNSEGDSGNVRNSPYVMQGSMGPNPSSDIIEGYNDITNSPYSQVTLNGWHSNVGVPECSEGYTRATAIFSQNLEDLRPPTTLHGVPIRQNAPYVPFQSTDSHGSTSNTPPLGSGSPTPTVMSPIASNFPDASFIPATPKPSSSSYISVDEAMKKVILGSELEPDQINYTVSNPEAYSRVTSFVNSPSLNTSNSNSSSLVMSAKNLQVEVQPKSKSSKFVTSVDGCGSMTKSTMV